MKISKTLATGVMATMVAAAVYVPAFAGLFDQQSSQTPDANRAVQGPCEPLTFEAANKLPAWVRASDVECMSLTMTDLRARQQARALLIQAAGQAQNQGGFSSSTTEAQYNEGVVAYADGRYADAIAHFRAAMPSVSRVEYKH
jgi:hypothetical protein